MDPAASTPGRPWARVPGSYLLVLRIDEPAEVVVGRLGSLAFPAGWYAYAGSALGGVAARLDRHLRPDKRCHWHIDYLGERAAAMGALALAGGRAECELATAAAALPGAARHAGRFGASDCRCPGHLVRIPSPHDLERIAGLQWYARPA